MLPTILLSVSLTASLCANAFLIFIYRKKPKKTQSQELQEFLGDLLSGPGIVAVSRIDPTSILLRSPKR